MLTSPIFSGVYKVQIHKNSIEPLETLRKAMWAKLESQVTLTNNIDEKLKLLEKAKTEPLFNQHRNVGISGFFKGGFGRTATVRKIR